MMKRCFGIVALSVLLAGCSSSSLVNPESGPLEDHSRPAEKAKSVWVEKTELGAFGWSFGTIYNTKTKACYVVVTTSNGVALSEAKDPANCE